jgi:Xaa-Pro aminopeptidase
VKSSFFQENRRRLSELIPDGLIILAGWTLVQWHGDTAAPFRQEANFWYLTGIEYADWRLIIDSTQQRSWLVAPEVDTVHELFDGSLKTDTAKAMSGVDEVIDNKEAVRVMQELARSHQEVYTVGAPPYAAHAGFMLNPAPERLRKELRKRFSEVKDCWPVVSKLRAIKQPEEIAAMERAAMVSVEAFEQVKVSLPTCRYEYEVEAELTYCMRRHNAIHAFEPIVAHGKNACTLHYTANMDELERGSLVLIDAGARTQGYPADITRTFAVGEPTAHEKALHAAVQIAQQQIIEVIEPNVTIEHYLKMTDAIMKEALMSVGIMKRASDTAVYRTYFPHAVSHGIGIDVHESLGGFTELRPGMVLTVEPGIYIPEEHIGVRIEDTVLVTDNGHRNLTARLSTDL